MDHSHIIEEKDLVLRALAYNDLEMTRRWRNKEEIRKCFFDQRIICKTEQTEWFKKYLTDARDLFFIIEWKKQAVGTAALYHIELDEKRAEFGRLMVGEETVRGMGIGRRTVEMLCCFGFEDLELENIYLQVFADNLKAIRGYQTVGFKIIKEFYADNRKVYEMNIDYNSLKRVI